MSTEKEQFEIELIKVQTARLIKVTRWIELEMFFVVGAIFALSLLAITEWLL